MSPKDQQIEIAKACGWKLMPRLFHNSEWKDVPTWVEKRFYEGQPEDYCAAGQYIGDTPPDYLNDLNAMHEAETQLMKRQKSAGHDMNTTDYGCWTRYVNLFDNNKFYGASIHATAAEKSEAFLKTLGLWK